LKDKGGSHSTVKISVLQNMKKFHYQLKLITRKHLTAPWELLRAGEAEVVTDQFIKK
jgi:hypothetical protein